MKTVFMFCSVLFGLMSASGLAHAEGKTTYDAKCKMCHGADGKGKPALKVPPFDLSKSDAELEKMIREGKGIMPSFKAKLTDQEIKDVIAHFRMLK